MVAEDQAESRDALSSGAPSIGGNGPFGSEAYGLRQCGTDSVSSRPYTSMMTGIFFSIDFSASFFRSTKANRSQKLSSLPKAYS